MNEATASLPIAARLRSARKNADMAQQDVADHLGIRRENVTQWESGDRTPNASNLRKLASVLGVSVDWLLGDGTDLEAGRDGTGDET